MTADQFYFTAGYIGRDGALEIETVMCSRPLLARPDRIEWASQADVFLDVLGPLSGYKADWVPQSDAHPTALLFYSADRLYFMVASAEELLYVLHDEGLIAVGG